MVNIESHNVKKDAFNISDVLVKKKKNVFLKMIFYCTVLFSPLTPD